MRVIVIAQPKGDAQQALLGYVPRPIRQQALWSYLPQPPQHFLEPGDLDEFFGRNPHVFFENSFHGPVADMKVSGQFFHGHLTFATVYRFTDGGEVVPGH